MRTEAIRRIIAPLAVTAACLMTWSDRVEAETIAGVIDDQGVPVVGAEVYAFHNPDGKGWTTQGLAVPVLTVAGGAYTLTLSPGDYKLFARRPGGDCYATDRWYDVAAPYAEGWVSDAADVITLNPAAALTGYDISMVQGGAWVGTVSAGGPASVWYRIERTDEFRIHHDMFTSASLHLGEYFMCGLVPGTYRMIAHDPTGAYTTLVTSSTYTVTGGVQGGPTPLTMVASVDAYEPNGTVATGHVIPHSVFDGPPGLWQESAYIRTRGSDVDFYCIDVEEGDRFLISTATWLPVVPEQRHNPWVDPMIGWFLGDGTLLMQNDDDPSGQRGLNASLDTGEIAAAGSYCVGVTIYGDGDFNATGQGIAGEYTLTIEPGNRRPRLSLWHLGNPTPAQPGAIQIDQGDTLVIDLLYPDPDGDAVTVTGTHLDSQSDPVLGGTLETNAADGSYTWDAAIGSDALSPYELIFTASDAEYTTERRVNVVVVGTNHPPTTPVLLSPPDGDRVPTATPTLTLQNSTDPDGDALSYEFELYLRDGSGNPAQTGTVAEQGGGTTGWTVATLPENTWVYWRARATDGQPTNGYSPWSLFFRFYVDVVNEPPPAPVLIKPVYDALILVQQPTLSASNVVDPDLDEVYYTFEVAEDELFTAVVATSPDVPVNTWSDSTHWLTSVPLLWDSTYYARVRAEDARGAQSDWSNVTRFTLSQIKPNEPFNVPTFASPLGQQCSGYMYCEAPDHFTVVNVDHPPNVTMQYQLQILDHVDDPDDPNVTPLEDVTVDEATEMVVTDIPVDPSIFQDDHRYWIRIRSWDGGIASDWALCDLWTNLQNQAPRGLRIVSPEPGAVFPLGTTAVTITVENGTDPDGQDGNLPSVAWCVDDNESLADCTAYPDEVPQSSSDPNETTSFTIDNLTPGWEAYYVGVRAVDFCGDPGEVTLTWFAISTTDATPKPGLADDGCCSTGGARSSLPPSALLALLILGFLLWRRRPRS